MYNFDIGIVTFEKRFDESFVPLLSTIRKFNTDSNIIVNINGNLRSKFNEDYRKKILRFITEYDNVFPFIWTEFRSLAKLWNNCIINSHKEFVLVLNDDVTISDEQFFRDIQSEIDNGNEFFSINNGFSFFVISKNRAADVGFFDERLLGVGWEDAEMCLRHGRVHGTQIKSIFTPHIKGTESPLVDGYAKATYETKLTKFSQFNKNIFDMICSGQVELISKGNLYPCEEFFSKNKNLL